jgi:hypothetical protein
MLEKFATLKDAGRFFWNTGNVLILDTVVYPDNSDRDGKSKSVSAVLQ